MENLVFTQLSIPEMRQLLKQELETYFTDNKQTNSVQSDQLLTIKQAAEILSLSVPTLYGFVFFLNVPSIRAEIPVSKVGVVCISQSLNYWNGSRRGAKKR